jgi:hypothetical protein
LEGVIDNTKIREKLAELCHSQWSGWMEYLFSKCDATMPLNLSALNNDSLVIPAEFVKRWARQMKTPYLELSEKKRIVIDWRLTNL